MLREILSTSDQILRGNSFSYWQPLFVPWLVFFAVDVAFVYLFPERVILQTFVGALILTQVFVLTHRIILIGPNAVHPWGLSKWGKKEIHFLAYMLVLEAAIPLSAAPLLLMQLPWPIYITYTLFFITFIVSLVVVIRCSPVLPATAVEDYIFLSGAWRLTKEHTTTMLVVVLILPIIAALPSLFLSPFQWEHYWLLQSLWYPVAMSICALVLSVSYKLLTERSASTTGNGESPISQINSDQQKQLTLLYDAFNRRDLDAIFSHFSDEIDWPNGMEGGRVLGIAGVRDYWLRQWGQISSTVEPQSFSASPVGITIKVHQVVRDLEGSVLSDSNVWHTFTFREDKIVRMDITTEGDE